MTADDADTPPPAGPSWLERLARKRWARWLVVLLVLPTLGLIALVLYLAHVFMEDEPVVYSKIEEHFKYGSTGGERESGFPYWIFQALPRVCALHLPGPGYASLGFTYEEGKDLPVGMSRRRYQGIDRTFLNCAVCHASTVRDTPEAKPRVYLGMPANTFNVWRFQKFLFDCAKDPRSSAEYVVPEIDRLMREKGERLGLVDRYLVYPVAIAIVRERLLMLRGRFEPLLPYPEWGPGRVDTFNAAKILFNFPLDQLPEHEKNGPSDFPSIWLQQPRKGKQLHWDGNNTVVEERNKSAAFGTGTTPPTIDLAAIGRVEDWLLTVEPPKYPYPIDAAKAARGAARLPALLRRLPRGERARLRRGVRGQGDAHRRHRHRSAPARLLHVRSRGEPVDPLRGLSVALPAFPQDLRLRQHAARRALAARALSAQRIGPERARPARAGVPAAQGSSTAGTTCTIRPVVGFVSNVPAVGERVFFKFDTAVPGNANVGHEGKAYGTELAPEDKDALVEYLKTF